MKRTKLLPRPLTGSSTQFRRLLFDFPSQFTLGIKAAESVRIPYTLSPKPYTLIIAGMGGSALPGDLLKALVISGEWKSPHPIIVRRDYGLSPALSSAKGYHTTTLVICISYSGNTEETLSAYKAARAMKLPMMAIASGGTLSAWAKRDNVPLTRVPADIPPRFAVGIQFGALVGLLVRAGLLTKQAERETLALSKILKVKPLLAPASALSRFFSGRIPIIYSASLLAPVAYSWKTNFNENAKIPAFANIFPELNHNEMNVFTRLSQKQVRETRRLALVILQDVKEKSKIAQRMRVTAALVKKVGVAMRIEKISGSSALERIFRAYLLGLATSGLLAESLGVDPIPVNLIEEFKKRLG